jgi:hypothetical protein
LGIWLQDVQAKLTERVAELEDQAEKDVQATTSHVQKGLTELVAALDKEMAAMKATEEALRAQMGEHWARYQEIFDQLKPFKEVRPLCIVVRGLVQLILRLQTLCRQVQWQHLRPVHCLEWPTCTLHCP